MTNYLHIGAKRNMKMKLGNGLVERPRCRNPDCQRLLYHRASIAAGVCGTCEREGK